MPLLLLFFLFPGDWVVQCFRKRNLAMRTWRSKALFCGLMSRYSHQNSKRSFKARIYDITHFATKVRVFIMVELVSIIPFSRRCMIKVLVDISIHIFSKGSFVWNAAFCVKCGLIADHFSSLGRMRTKSAIAAFYGSSAQDRRIAVQSLGFSGTVQWDINIHLSPQATICKFRQTRT